MDLKKEIEMRFDESNLRNLKLGQKVCTHRSSQRGERGDWFIADGVMYVILDVWGRTLVKIREDFFHLEGFETPDEFEADHRSRHNGEFDCDEFRVIHWFARIR